MAVFARPELAFLGVFVIEQHRNLPRTHHAAVLGSHPHELARHLDHGLLVSADLGAIKQELIVLVLVVVMDHEADPELLPLLVHLEGLNMLIRLVVDLHMIEVLGRVRILRGN